VPAPYIPRQEEAMERRRRWEQARRSRIVAGLHNDIGRLSTVVKSQGSIEPQTVIRLLNFTDMSQGTFDQQPAEPASWSGNLPWEYFR
jgi:hypothetical protein